MLLEFVMLAAAVLVYLYISLSYNFSYWRRKGVAHFPGTIVLKMIWDQLMGRSPHMGLTMEKWYKEYKARGDRYFGNWTFFRPSLFLLDLDLCKLVLTKDFNHFVARDFAPTSHEYITKHLFSLEGQEWKDMRSKLTPTFTSGKIKNMFALMRRCVDQLQEHVEQEVVTKDEGVDVKDLVGRFTTDIIVTCAFGVEVNCIENPENRFYQIGKTVFSFKSTAIIDFIAMRYLPRLAEYLDLRFISPEVTELLTTLMRDTADFRRKNNVVRNDFVDLLLRVKEDQSLDDETDENNQSKQQKTRSIVKSSNQGKDRLTLEEMTAQAFVFFFAGYETSASTISFCFYELAKNHDIQEKLQREIDDVLSRLGGEITYQAVQEMTYMDQVMSETMRRYASLAMLSRVCTERYQFPGSDLVIDKGVRVNIPTYAIHHDPEIYPHPYKFDPERFSEQSSRDRHHYAFLPFGEGPRNCIGMRFGKLQVKLGLTAILSRYQLFPAPDTPPQLDIHPYNPVTTPRTPFRLRITRRTNL